MYPLSVPDLKILDIVEEMSKRLQQHKIPSFEGHRDLCIQGFLVKTKTKHLSSMAKTLIWYQNYQDSCLRCQEFHDSYCFENLK